MARKRITKIPDFEIPFDLDGNLIPYECEGRGVKHRPNFIFEGYLKFVGMERGRSAAHFIVTDRTDKQFTMFMTDVLYVLQNRTIEDGQTWAKWTFCKRGANFGVTLYEGP